MTKVFLDANILYSNTVRSLFIWLHTNGAVQIYWSIEAWEETFRNYEEKNGTQKGRLFRKSMQDNAIDKFSECLATPTPEVSLELKDPDDEHIVSAATKCAADYLLTNDKVLIGEKLSMKAPVICTADDFLTQLIQQTPDLVRQSVKDHISSLKSSPTFKTYCDSLNRSELKKTSVEVAKWQ